QDPQYRRSGRGGRAARLGSAVESEHDQRSRADETRNDLARRRNPNVDTNLLRPIITSPAPARIRVVRTKNSAARFLMPSTQIILTENVPGLGAEADVVKVRRGYARNFLLPTGKAHEVTPRAMRQIDMLKAKR